MITILLVALVTRVLVYIFRLLVAVKRLLSPLRPKHFASEYVALKLIGTQMLSLQRLAAGYVDIRATYVSCRRTPPPSHGPNVPFDAAECVCDGSTLYRSADCAHGEVILVWIESPWDPPLTAAFARRIGDAVGCHVLVHRAVIDGTQALREAALAATDAVTAALATIEHASIVIGGFEVGATVALHMLPDVTRRCGSPLGVLLFDPFVGWRRPEPTDIGIDLAAPGAALAKLAYNVDEACGQRFCAWFPPWRVEFDALRGPHVACPLLLCCDSRSLWLSQVRDFQASMVSSGVDCAVEVYDSGCAVEPLVAFMADAELWLDQVITVQGFAARSVSSTPCAFRRFRSLATGRVLSGTSRLNSCDTMYEAFMRTSISGDNLLGLDRPEDSLDGEGLVPAKHSVMSFPPSPLKSARRRAQVPIKPSAHHAKTLDVFGEGDSTPNSGRRHW